MIRNTFISTGLAVLCGIPGIATELTKSLSSSRASQDMNKALEIVARYRMSHKCWTWNKANGVPYLKGDRVLLKGSPTACFTNKTHYAYVSQVGNTFQVTQVFSKYEVDVKAGELAIKFKENK